MKSSQTYIGAARPHELETKSLAQQSGRLQRIVARRDAGAGGGPGAPHRAITFLLRAVYDRATVEALRFRLSVWRDLINGPDEYFPAHVPSFAAFRSRVSPQETEQPVKSHPSA